MGRNLRIADAVEHFHQPKNGYRSSADSILLADFVSVKRGERVADFGAGCGVVGLSALEKGRVRSVKQLFFVEREPVILGCLRENMSLYQPRTATELLMVPADWRKLTVDDFGGELDYVMVNPPYFGKNDGRLSPCPAVEAGRREIYGNLSDLIQCISLILASTGRVALVLPARRKEELLDIIKIDFTVTRFKVVTGKGNLDRLILAEICKSS